MNEDLMNYPLKKNWLKLQKKKNKKKNKKKKKKKRK